MTGNMPPSRPKPPTYNAPYTPYNKGYVRLNGPSQPEYLTPPQPEAPRKAQRRAKRTALIILATFLGGLLVLCGIGMAVAATSDPPAKHNPLIDTVTATPPAATKAPEANGAAAAAVPSAAASSKPALATTVPPAPPAGFGDEGTLLVPSEVKPGTYRATVPGDSFNCYWARLKGTSNEFDNILANGNAKPGAKVTVTVKASDKAFHSQGCGFWSQVS